MAQATPWEVTRALRGAVRGGAALAAPSGGTVAVGGSEFPQDTPTAFIRKDDERYTLGALVVLLLHPGEAGAQIRACRELKLPWVQTQHAAGVAAYLRGETDECAVLAAAEPEKRPAGAAPAGAGGAPAPKRARTEAALVAGETDPEKVAKRLADAIAGRERMLRDRNSMMQAARDFAAVLTTWNRFTALEAQAEKRAARKARKKSKARKAARRGGGGAAAVEEDSSSDEEGDEALKWPAGTRKGLPIVVVPAGASAVLGLANVRGFLEGDLYSTVAEAKAASRERPHRVTLWREVILAPGEPPVTVGVEVVDSTKQLRTSDWNRVAAVFTEGHAWQFRGWPGPWAQPLHVFGNALGIHLHFDNVAPNAQALEWNVRAVPLAKSRRHGDGVKASQLWDMIVQYMHNNKRWLLKESKKRALARPAAVSEGEGEAGAGAAALEGL